MSVLWGNDEKTCRECGMKIPYIAKKCPYCHSEQKDSLYNDIENFGCLGLPVVLIIILILFYIIGKAL